MPSAKMTFGLEEPLLRGILWTGLAPVVSSLGWYFYFSTLHNLPISGYAFAGICVSLQLLIGRQIVKGAPCPPRLLQKKLEGQVFIVTGTGSGSGYHTALQLAKQGATVILGNRSVARSQECAERMEKEAGMKLKLVTKHTAELESLDSVKKFADEISAEYPKIEALINNAGMADFARRMVGKYHDNLEFCTVVDAIAPIALTMRMLPLIKKSNARVVMVSSIGHGIADQWKDAIPKKAQSAGVTDITSVTQFFCGEFGGDKAQWLETDKTLQPFSYGFAKQLVLSFADYLKTQHGVNASSCQPGSISGGFYRDFPVIVQKVFVEGLAYCVANRTAKEGAQTNLWLALESQDTLNKLGEKQIGTRGALYANNCGIGLRGTVAQAATPGISAVEWIVRKFC